MVGRLLEDLQSARYRQNHSPFRRATNVNVFAKVNGSSSDDGVTPTENRGRVMLALPPMSEPVRWGEGFVALRLR